MQQKKYIKTFQLLLPYLWPNNRKDLKVRVSFAVIALVSVVTCKLVSNILYGHSFFDRQLLDSGIDISLGRTHLKLGSLNIMKFTQSTGYLSMDKSSKVTQVIDEMVKKNVTEVYLTNSKKEFLGKVLLGNLTKTSTSKVIDEIEKRVGKPVITSNQAQFWSCLRRAGVKDNLKGFGKLFDHQLTTS